LHQDGTVLSLRKSSALPLTTKQHLLSFQSHIVHFKAWNHSTIIQGKGANLRIIYCTVFVSVLDVIFLCVVEGCSAYDEIHLARKLKNSYGFFPLGEGERSGVPGQNRPKERS